MHFAPRVAERGASARQTEAEARASNDPEALLAGLTARHYDLLGSPQVGDRLSVSFAIDELGQRLASPAVPNPRIARDYLELGDVDAMRNALATFEARARAIGVASWLWLPALWAATMALMEGRLDEAEELSVRARDIGRHVRGPDAADAVHAAQLFALYQLQDRLGELAPVLEVFPDTQPHRPVWRAAAACAWADGGDCARAEAMLAPLADAGWDSLPVNVDLPVTLTLAAWVAGALDAPAWARGLYERLLPYRDLCVVVGVWPAVCSGSAAYPVAASTAGVPEAAAAAFTHAHSVNERIGATPWVARVDAARAHHTV